MATPAPSHQTPSARGKQTRRGGTAPPLSGTLLEAARIPSAHDPDGQNPTHGHTELPGKLGKHTLYLSSYTQLASAMEKGHGRNNQQSMRQMLLPGKVCNSKKLEITG